MKKTISMLAVALALGTTAGVAQAQDVGPAPTDSTLPGDPVEGPVDDGVAGPDESFPETTDGGVDDGFGAPTEPAQPADPDEVEPYPGDETVTDDTLPADEADPLAPAGEPQADPIG